MNPLFRIGTRVKVKTWDEIAAYTGVDFTEEEFHTLYAVVYDEASGDIHALTSISGELLDKLLTTEQSSPESLAEALLGASPTEDVVSMVRRILLEFESMGFVEPCDL